MTGADGLLLAARTVRAMLLDTRLRHITQADVQRVVSLLEELATIHTEEPQLPTPADVRRVVTLLEDIPAICAGEPPPPNKRLPPRTGP